MKHKAQRWRSLYQALSTTKMVVIIIIINKKYMFCTVRNKCNVGYNPILILLFIRMIKIKLIIIIIITS